MKTNHFLKPVLFMVFVSLSLLTSIANAKDAKKEHDKKQVKYLFVQFGAKGKIEVHKKHKDLYLLTLEKVSPYVSYFSDRPYRIAGHMKIDKFENLWKKRGHDSFKDDPPNAELVALQGQSEDKIINFPVELTEPQYDQKSGTLTYTVKALKKNDMPSLPQTLDHVFLFIDDVCLSCWGS